MYQRNPFIISYINGYFVDGFLFKSSSHVTWVWEGLLLKIIYTFLFMFFYKLSNYLGSILLNKKKH